MPSNIIGNYPLKSCIGVNMEKFYEKQDDGCLKPIDIPATIIQSVGIYLWLRGNALTLEEVKFILTSPELKHYPREST